MASPEEFTLESVRDFMIYRGGRVTNHELVQHFKPFLTHTANKEIARNQFKEYVNTLSNVVKENDNKYLVLKKRFRVGTALSESAYLSHPNDSPGQPPFPGSPDPGYAAGGYAGPAGYSPNVSAGSYNSPLPPPPLQGPSYGHPAAPQYGGAVPSPQSYLHHHGSQIPPQDYRSPPPQPHHAMAPQQYHQSPHHMTPQQSQYSVVSSQPPPLLRQDSMNSHYQGFPPASHPQYPGSQHPEPPAPPLPPRSQQHPNSSPYNNNGGPSPGGPQQQVYTPPRYRAPPPYRPPPGHVRTPPDPNMYQGTQGPSFPAPLPHHNHHHQSQQPTHDYYPAQQQPMQHSSSVPKYPDDFSHRDLGVAPVGGIHAYRNEPADLGIPPTPVQSMRSSARGNNGSSSPMNVSSSSTTSRPNILPVQQMPSGETAPPPPPHHSANNASADELPQLRSTKSKSKSKTPPSGLETSGNSATPSPVADSSASDSPVALHRQRRENKENHRPSLTNSESSNSRQESPSSAGDDTDPRAGGGLRAGADSEKKISVKEKTQIFNKMASETNLADRGQKAGGKSNRGSRAEKDYDDSISILNYGQDGQDWLVASACSDFNEILRLLKVHPELARRKDRNNGYTALHWAAKHGRVEVVKLLAGTHQTDPNARSNGGYTPLHLAAMYNRQDVFDLLVHYGSELNVRDYSGKKPRQYNTIASSTISPEHHKRKYPLQQGEDKDLASSSSILDVAAPDVIVQPPEEDILHRGGRASRLGGHKRHPVAPSASFASAAPPEDAFSRSKKGRTSLFARASMFASKRKKKAKRHADARHLFLDGGVSQELADSPENVHLPRQDIAHERRTPHDEVDDGQPRSREDYHGPPPMRGGRSRRGKPTKRYKHPRRNRQPSASVSAMSRAPPSGQRPPLGGPRGRSDTHSSSSQFESKKAIRSPSIITTLFGFKKRSMSVSQPNLSSPSSSTYRNFKEPVDADSFLITASGTTAPPRKQSARDRISRPSSVETSAALDAAPVQVFHVDRRSRNHPPTTGSSNSPAAIGKSPPSGISKSPAPWPAPPQKPARKKSSTAEYDRALDDESTRFEQSQDDASDHSHSSSTAGRRPHRHDRRDQSRREVSGGNTRDGNNSLGVNKVQAEVHDKKTSRKTREESESSNNEDDSSDNSGSSDDSSSDSSDSDSSDDSTSTSDSAVTHTSRKLSAMAIKEQLDKNRALEQRKHVPTLRLHDDNETSL